MVNEAIVGENGTAGGQDWSLRSVERIKHWGGETNDNQREIQEIKDGNRIK